MITLTRSDVEVTASDPGRRFAFMGIETTSSQYLHRKIVVTTAAAAAMQKSKSSSSVVHHGGRLMAKKIFRSRSKSQTRPTHATCSWTPQGGCVWTNIVGKQVVLGDASLLHLNEIERKVLQKVALAKLQALNLGVTIKIPSENVGASISKQKRRPYLLKRKALTTSIFDTNRKDNEKDGSTSGGLVFGIPLSQCIENDRLARSSSANSPFQNQSDLSGEESSRSINRTGSRSSFSSLIEGPRGDERGSCESLMLKERLLGSVPGLLDSLSCGSASDLHLPGEEAAAAIPNVLSACIRHLEQYGLHTLGIFRVSTSKKRIRQLREGFDCGKETALEDDQCPHDVATLLKEFLRDLPDPLLCRDLYHAFVQTQKIRNRRLQFEALQHLIQLLPTANRDTLFALLSFLANVAKYANDHKNDAGECVSGNKMDSNNLATVFAPNILHCFKPGLKEAPQDRPEDRIDVINVVRTLIDHFKQLYTVPAELIDEIYVHMMDAHPEELEKLMTKRDTMTTADESVEELDSESYSAPWSPTAPTSEMSIDNAEMKRVYSREEFLHEAAATGGPNVGMRVRHKDRIRERSCRKKREESASRRRREEEAAPGITSAIMFKLRGGPKDEDHPYGKNRSSSLESTSSTCDSDVNRVLRIADDERRRSSPYVLDNSGVITASLTIPVQTAALNVDDDIPFIEDVESGRQQLTIGVVRAAAAPPRRRQRSMSGSDSSVASGVQLPSPAPPPGAGAHGYDSAVGSTTCSSTVQNTPNSDAVYSSPASWGSTPPTSPDATRTAVNYIPDDTIKNKATLQRVTFSPASEVQYVKTNVKSTIEHVKNISSPPFETQHRPEREKFTPTITSIGNAVLRSRTADFERIAKTDSKMQKASTVAAEKKKYTKRRYTDSRHQMRHIPDSETLESASAAQKKETTSATNQTPMYKRRELISSVPSK